MPEFPAAALVASVLGSRSARALRLLLSGSRAESPVCSRWASRLQR